MELNSELTLEELGEVLDSLASGKASGKDGFPAEALKQLQEKCREQMQPLFVAFIDLTKAFDLVSRDGLFKILSKTGCPPRLLSIIRSFHKNIKGTVVFDGLTLDALDIRSGLLQHAFGSATEGIYLRIRSVGKHFNLARPRAKTKVRLRCLRDFLFADDAAVTAHSTEDLTRLMTRFSKACQAFELAISLQKIQVRGKEWTPDLTSASPITNWKTFTTSSTLGRSTISESLALDAELNKRTGKSSTTMYRLKKRVWANNKLTECKKIQVYSARDLSTLLYGNESWTLRIRQERQLHACHMRCLRHILEITWQDKMTNNSVLGRARITTTL
ncbi:uncharacterized protein [Procambarus clarkii]|uniref:uncharacterized protein n=1 Tax=Procambarus clarkii TaxID=6728 RepID=UPI003742A644